MTLQIGCQTYTWQMSYEKNANLLPKILKTVELAGFAGVEPEVCMLGPYRCDPHSMERDLAALNMKLAAVTIALPWNDPVENEEEKEQAKFVFEFLKNFSGTLLMLVNLPGSDRSNLYERQKNALACLNAVGKRATEQGLTCAFHPNSPPGSIFRVAEDYDVMFEKLDTRYIGYVPDTGHIANGDMSPLEVIRKNRNIIRHVHFKDISADKQWTAMGEGVIDHSSIVTFLKDTEYEGWIMIEDESIKAETDPDGVTLRNGDYTRKVLLPILQNDS